MLFMEVSHDRGQERRWRRGRSRPGWLSREQCEKVHEASLQVLARTGVRLDEPEAVELVRRAGATVDGDIVRLPAKLIEAALAAAPREFTIYDREGRPAIKLDGSRTYFGPGSDCMHIVDHRSGERRAPVLQDVLEGVTLCDALEHIDFAMSLFLPRRRAAADGRPPPDARDAERHDQASHLRDLRHVRLRRRHRHGRSRRRRSVGAGRAAVPGLLHQHGQRSAAQP